MEAATSEGEINMSKLIISLVLISLIIIAYYNFILKAEPDENKPFKLLKRILILFILIGLLHIYSVIEDTNLKQFFLVIIAVIINVFSVINSTKNTELKRMRIINLTLTSAGVTILVAGLLWYVTHNSLFGFIIDKNETVKDVKDTIGKTFNSKIIDKLILKTEDGCPLPHNVKCIDESNIKDCKGKINVNTANCLLDYPTDTTKLKECKKTNETIEKCNKDKKKYDECIGKKKNYKQKMNELHDKDNNKFNKCLENEVRKNLKSGF